MDYKYNFGATKNGLYIDVNGSGQAYNILLFVKSISNNKTGIIRVSETAKRGYIKCAKDKPSDKLDDYYIPDINKRAFRGISLWFIKERKKTLYLKIIPTTIK